MQQSARSQVEQARDQLVQALIQRDDAQRALDQANERIRAIRNLLAGITLGQQLQKEIDVPKDEPQE